MPNPSRSTGDDILRLARKHLGETYILGCLAPKNSSTWRGPWDCAEFVSWITYQVAEVLYGCENDNGDPATADAYTGYWCRDAQTRGSAIPIEQAANTPGAAVLRIPVGGATGHIVISDGKGGTVEAYSSRRGVIESTLDDRRWDVGILVPGIEYAEKEVQTAVAPPRHMIYRLTDPWMTDSTVKEIQRALKLAGFDPDGLDGKFGPHTQAAVIAFQLTRGLVADGEVGPKTARALKIDLPLAE